MSRSPPASRRIAAVIATIGREMQRPSSTATTIAVVAEPSATRDEYQPGEADLLPRRGNQAGLFRLHRLAQLRLLDPKAS